jgi:predicted TIM-barrel fold metal-dependent hydrolase
MTNSPSLPQCAMPHAATRKPAWMLPDGSVDAHMHVFGNSSKYPLNPSRLFEPPAVTWADYLAVLRTIGVGRAVLVHSAVYGTNNSVTADAIATAPERFRGVALVNETTTDKELEQLAQAGFCGFRVNLVSGRGIQLKAARQMAERVRPLGWHAQFLIDIESIPNLDEVFADFPVDVVIDHMGRPDPTRGTSSPAFQALVRLLESCKGWSKISAPYRTSRIPPSYVDMRPFAAALVTAAPNRLVWGTDWPHVMVTDHMPNDGDLCDQLGEWVRDESLRTKILVDNPRELYGFSDS